MKNFKLKQMILAIVVLFGSLTTMAQNEQEDAQAEEGKKWKVSLEIDPATFAFGGYGAHVRFQPKSCDHLLFGAGVYAMDMPDVLVNLNEKNRDMGSKVRLNQGTGLFLEHHFTEVNRKFFVGGQLSIQQYKIEKDFYDGDEKFTNALIMGYGGYTLQPFEFPLYFKLWGGIGYNNEISGSNELGDATYDISPITGFATLHIGFTF
jgi:hypothetical protein